MKKTGCMMLLGAALLMGSPQYIQASAATLTTAPAQQAIHGLTPEEATKKAGFSVKLPDYVPAGFHLVNLSFAPATGQVVGAFVSQNAKPVHITMWKGTIGEETNGLAETVLKHGTAYSGKKVGAFGEETVLLWEEEQGVLYQISGNLSIDEMRKMAESVHSGNLQTGKDPEVIWIETEDNLSITEASQKIGFTVKMPTYLPKGTELAISYFPGITIPSVDMYSKIAKKGMPFISISVRKGDLLQEACNGVAMQGSVQIVKIGDKFGYTGKFPGSSFSDPTLTAFNGLTWEEDEGIIYTIKSDLSIEEIIKMAESVK